jgi:Fe-S-cluster containining protein
MDCLKCGTCCTAPDIMTLGKPLGVRCRHLDENGLCAIYEERPAVCRGYLVDRICLEVAAPTLAERVEKYLRLFEL